MTVTKSATGKLFQRVPVPLYLENFQHSHRTIWLYAGRLHCFTAVIVVCALWDLLEPPPHTHCFPPRAATFTHAWEKTHTSPRTTVNHLQGTNKKTTSTGARPGMCAVTVEEQTQGENVEVGESAEVITVLSPHRRRTCSTENSVKRPSVF